MQATKWRSLCLPAVLCICNSRSGCVVSVFLVSTSFPLLPLLRLLRRCRNAFLLLLQAAQRVRMALFPLPLLPPPLSVLVGNALLLLQATDALLLGRADQLSQLDGLDMVQGRLAGLVQHNGVGDDVEQRNARNLLQACGDCVVLENMQIHQEIYVRGHQIYTQFLRNFPFFANNYMTIPYLIFNWLPRWVTTAVNTTAEAKQINIHKLKIYRYGPSTQSQDPYS